MATAAQTRATQTFGIHGWVPETQFDFSAGFFRDVPRHVIPPNGCYDARDLWLLPGLCQKRGGTAYAGPAMSGATYAQAVVFATFPLVGAKLIAMENGSSPDLYEITASATTSLGTMTGFIGTLERPKLFFGGANNILVFPSYDGSATPWFYDGVQPPREFLGGGTGQTLTITGSPTGGSFKLQIQYVDPQQVNFPAKYRTAAIAYNASAATVQAAINTALTGTGTAFSGVTGGNLPGTPVNLVKPNTKWSVSWLTPSVSGVSLTGGTNPTGTITTAATPTDVPWGRLCEMHLDRCVLANAADNQNRLWFSPPIDIVGQPWNTAESWIDFPDTISGLASLSDALIVFSTRGMWRIGGSNPPAQTVGYSDMFVQPIGKIGCTDARSILVTGSQVVFANPHGVYITTGIEPVSLMDGTVSSYWQALFSGYNPSFDVGEGWTVSTGLYAKRWLFCTVLDSSGGFVDCLVYDFVTKGWQRATNMRFRMYSSAYGQQEELYAASRATNRVVALSGCFAPASSNKADADGTAVAPVLETRPFGGGPALSRFGRAHLTYDMRDPGSDNPTLAVAVANGYEAPSYTAAPESPLAETSDSERRRFMVAREEPCVSIRVTQANASAKTEIRALEIGVRAAPLTGENP